MKIREATSKDLDALKVLSFDFLSSEAKKEPSYEPEYALTESSANYLLKRVNSENSLFLVVEEESNLVGFLIGYIGKIPDARKSMKPAVLDEIYVADKFRGKGVGKKLLQKFQDWAKSHGANKLRVGTHFRNDGAIKFYKDAGFEDFYVKLEKKI